MFVTEGGTMVYRSASVEFSPGAEAAAEIEFPQYYQNRIIALTTINADSVNRSLNVYIGSTGNKEWMKVYYVSGITPGTIVVWPNTSASAANLRGELVLGNVFRFLTVKWAAAAGGSGGAGYLRVLTREVNTAENAADE